MTQRGDGDGGTDDEAAIETLRSAQGDRLLFVILSEAKNLKLDEKQMEEGTRGRGKEDSPQRRRGHRGGRRWRD